MHKLIELGSMKTEFVDPHDLLEKVGNSHLWDSADKLLVAVSGGMDSMVLLDVLRRVHAKLFVAHVNYQLRGQDADEDEQLVRSYCSEHEISCHVLRADPAQQDKSNLQLWARQLRYNWLEQLRQELGLSYIVLGHHQSDQVETILYRLSRGAGLKGISGMQERSGVLCRPLLKVPHRAISEYATYFHVPYRHDQSNNSLDYDRNFIRHQIVPLFQRVEPAFLARLTSNAHHWRQAELALNHYLDQDLAQRVIKKSGYEEFQITDLDSSYLLNVLIHRWLASRDFSESQIEDMVRHALRATSGKSFLSSSHRVVTSRTSLQLLYEDPDPIYETLTPGTTCHTPQGDLVVGHVESFRGMFDHGPDVAVLDHAKLKAPLVLRNWQSGDRFYPLGMEGQKKVKKFLTDSKVSSVAKQRQLVCSHEDEICWIVGLRLDDRYRVERDTKRIIKLQWKKK